MAERIYFALLDPEKDGGYSVTFPEIGTIVTEGDDLEEAVSNAREALELTLESEAEEGRDAPPSDPAKVVIAREMSACAVLVAIPAALPGKSQRINVTMEESLVARVDRAASHLGWTRSSFLAEAARAALRDRAKEGVPV